MFYERCHRWVAIIKAKVQIRKGRYQPNLTHPYLTWVDIINAKFQIRQSRNQPNLT